MKIEEIKELDVNMSLPKVIYNLDSTNCCDAFKIMKKIFGISYKRIADVMGVSPSCFRMGMSFGTFDGVIGEEKVKVGIREIKEFFLRY